MISGPTPAPPCGPFAMRESKARKYRTGVPGTGRDAQLRGSELIEVGQQRRRGGRAAGASAASPRTAAKIACRRPDFAAIQARLYPSARAQDSDFGPDLAATPEGRDQLVHHRLGTLRRADRQHHGIGPLGQVQREKGAAFPLSGHDAGQRGERPGPFRKRRTASPPADSEDTSASSPTARISPSLRVRSDALRVQARGGESGMRLATLAALNCASRGRSSVGRASASQAEGRGFDPRRPLRNGISSSSGTPRILRDLGPRSRERGAPPGYLRSLDPSA